MWNDPRFGPVLSVLAWSLAACMVFLGLTVPFSAVLHSDPGITAGVIATLAGALGLVLQARDRLGDKDDPR